MSQRYNTPDATGVLHYVTLNIRERRRAFCRDSHAILALEELRYSCDAFPGKLVAYVVMPDHIHFVAGIDDGRLSVFLAQFKSAVTKSIEQLAQQENDAKVLHWLHKDGHPNLWQEGKHSFHLWSGYMIRQKINYIHNNPVRAGLVERPGDYLWSSIKSYFPELRGEPPIPVDIVW